ncbi:MAG TPA: ATP-grasp domain-containing protein [Pseudonocardiaceae bacterium]|jgi:biotin carboxylase|nr:ATP-grasp domain-containing protein [Pseudonocardiaceae bacterium]
MPQDRLCLVALNPTDSVTQGFLPAAAALGLRVTLLTDQPDAHHAAGAGQVADVVFCAVRDHRALIDQVDRLSGVAAVFSNSDHLQSQTALAASYFGLPAKDWRAALRSKNKALMRRHLAAVDPVWSRELAPGSALPDAPFPCVVKPREGVASEDVVLVADAAELATACQDIWRRRPEPLVVEEFLTGELRTVETVGDADGPRVLGGFRTTLSPPPYFVERSMVFDPAPHAGPVLAQLAALGVGFGACHTEYVVDGDRARIIEVNYRVIGDQCDLLLADLTGIPLFEHILRVHLGEPLPPPAPPTASRARIDYPCAERSGRLVAAPPALDECRDGVRLTYRPLRDIGGYRDLTHTNRDYLGVLRTIGTDQPTVDRVAAEFLAGLRWDVQP